MEKEIEKILEDWQNDITMSGELVKRLLALFEKEKEETVKQVRYGHLGRCPVHDNALRCLKCVETLREDWNAER